MTSKSLMIAAAILAGTTVVATTAGFAQDYYGGGYGRGYYDYGGVGPSNFGPATPDVDRGGPGPRVQAGSGTGIGAVR